MLKYVLFLSENAFVYSKMNDFQWICSPLDYLASVSISLGDKCSQAINIATKEIEKRILNNERKSLRKDLK